MAVQRLKSMCQWLSMAACLVVVGGCKTSGGANGSDPKDGAESTDSSPAQDSADDQADTAATADRDTADRGAFRYLALGDSYTIGTRISYANNFPNQLAERLGRDGLAVAEPVNIAQNGWTTEQLDAAIDRQTPQGPFDVVTLLIGVNNQFGGQSADAFEPEFVELVDAAIGFAGGQPGRVVVVSIPDYSVTPFGQQRRPAETAQDLQRFNAVCRRQADRAHVRFVDITPISRQAADDPDLVAADGLHPSAQMYGLWVDQMAPVVKDVLER